MIISKNLNSLKHQNKAEFKNLDDWSPQYWFFKSLWPLQPPWPHQPLRPQWPLQPQMPFFTKKLPGPDGWIIPGTKMTNTVSLLWNNSSKIQIFTDILYTFCRRLLRPADVTFLKTMNVYQKFIISAFQNYCQTRFYLHISICQSQFIKSSSMWDTLYKKKVGYMFLKACCKSV